MTMTSIAGRLSSGRRPAGRISWLLAALAFAALLLPQVRPASAQYTTKCWAGDLTSATATLPEIPEIASHNGILKGTVVLADAQRSVTLPKKGSNGEATCVPQLQRFFQRGESTVNPDEVNPPRPGPTLRGQLGDVVELIFLNQINTLDYGDSIDLSQKGIGTGCDSVTNGSGYPNFPKGTVPASDTYPNCFHGSTSGNLHFHGTHTSPSYTADNVFLAVAPSPRAGGAPRETGALVQAEFDSFFANCKAKLDATNLLEWPATWSEMGLPKWLERQKAMMADFDKGKPDAQQLLRADDMVDKAGGFPQYYIGSFPYCFLLPHKPINQPVDQGTLRMGQSPGTMWYHAHKHGSTAIDVSNGMLGAFIIEDNSPEGYDGYIKGFYAKHPNNRGTKGQKVPDQLWPIKETVMVVNQVAGTPKLETGSGSGPVPFSINGYVLPTVSMYPGEVQMWRIVNGSTISGFYLPAMPPGFTWRQTAQDGVQFDTPNYISREERPVFVAPGNRIDLLVQAPAKAGSTTSFPVQVTQGVSQSGAEKTLTPTTPLMTIMLTGSGPAMNPTPSDPADGFPAAMPPRPAFLNDIGATNAPERSLNFNTAGQGSGHSQHTIAIDGGPQAKFEEGPPLTIAKLGTIEEWKISNTTNGSAINDPIDHPFHIHINPFQVTEVFDPNAPLQDAKGHTIFKNGDSTPLYVFSGTCVPNKNGNGPHPVAPCWTATDQCLLDGNVAASWHPCPAMPSPYSRSTNIWWDVFPIPDGITNPVTKKGVIAGYFKMKTRFVDYNGSYVLHCHILAHEDRGMMLQVNLAPTPQMSMMQHH